MCMGQGVGGNGDLSMRLVPEERTKKSKEDLRELWRKAILQQILLQRMERENQKLQGERKWIKTQTNAHAYIAFSCSYKHVHKQNCAQIFKYTLYRQVKIRSTY